MSRSMRAPLSIHLPKSTMLALIVVAGYQKRQNPAQPSLCKKKTPLIPELPHLSLPAASQTLQA